MSATYRVVREGVSQRENGRFIDYPVGAEIECSDKAAAYLLAEGFIEPLKGSAEKEE